MPLLATAELGPVYQANEQRLQRGIICTYITESPEDYETDRLAEPFGSPYDPTVPRATRAQATSDHPIFPVSKPEPVQRPSSGTVLPDPKMQGCYRDYLAQQFNSHRPAVAQVGLIGVSPSLTPTGLGGQRAYNQPYLEKPSVPSSLFPSISPLNVPSSACDYRPPYGANPSLKAPHVPTTEQLLEGVHVPSWDQLDVAYRQIKELYALRALLDPQGHQRRTHVTVLPNIPSEDHRIWGGPVPLVSGNPQVQDAVHDWESLGGFSRGCPSVCSYETRPTEESRTCSPYTTEPGRSTPASVLEGLAELDFVIEELDSESDSESEGEDAQYQSDSDGVPLRDVVKAWNQLDDMMVKFRVRSDLFVYPAELDFIPAYGTDDKPLLDQQSFRNRWFVRHWQFLYRLLDELSGTKSLSERMTVALRGAVDEVNRELDRVEEYAAKLWEKECQKIEQRRLWRSVFSSEHSDAE
ncbi:unnamed protein product [Rhizoctonia solani]|uniref:Uncharacterized protein n=1 Tax=Rhizoctonia solani TaxID=456999 RepID=A0A8H2WFR1_9AGAM|nr:unnamed protein product [Rhizoctonia solani]